MNGIVLAKAIRLAHNRRLRAGTSRSDIAAWWWRFRAYNTHKQRYTQLVVYRTP